MVIMSHKDVLRSNYLTKMDVLNPSSTVFTVFTRTEALGGILSRISKYPVGGCVQSSTIK